VKSKAVIQFLKDWRELQHGMIHRNGRVKVEYYQNACRIVSRYGVAPSSWQGMQLLEANRT